MRRSRATLSPAYGGGTSWRRKTRGSRDAKRASVYNNPSYESNHMTKICDIPNVREYAEGFPVECWIDDDTGRLQIVARNQDGHDCTNIDFGDLMRWVATEPAALRVACMQEYNGTYLNRD